MYFLHTEFIFSANIHDQLHLIRCNDCPVAMGGWEKSEEMN